MVNVNFGLDIEDGIGFEVKIVAVSAGIQIGFITIKGYAGGIGIFMYKGGNIEIGAILGFGGSISINIIDYLKFKKVLNRLGL